MVKVYNPNASMIIETTLGLERRLNPHTHAHLLCGALPVELPSPCKWQHHHTGVLMQESITCIPFLHTTLLPGAW